MLQDGIPDAAYKPLTGDDKETARYYLKANRDAKAGQGGFDFGTGQASLPAMKPLALDFSGFRDLPEDTVEQIGAKAARFKELRKGQAFVRATAAANLYVAAFLLPKVGGAPAGASSRTVPTTEELWLALNQGKMRQAMIDAPKAARRARAFHWPLEFPDVMQRGGFDVVLGNPPWERIKLQEQEFFASRSPEIANAPNKAARDRLIKALEKAEPGSADRALFDAFVQAKREAEATSEFVRVSGEDGGRFALTGRGDVNTYALFAELFSRATRNRAGVIVPTGIVTDFTTRFFFEDLVRSRRLVSALMFDNAWKIFPAIHPDTPFALLTMGVSEDPAVFASYLLSTEHLVDRERRYRLSPAEIVSINPNTKTAPLFRSRSDAEITAKIYANAPVLIDENIGANGNPWGASFARLFDMSNDSHLFQTGTQLREAGFACAGTAWEKDSERFVPLYEAKMVHQFDHRWASYDEAGEGSTDLELAQKQNPDVEPRPRYWVPQAEIDVRLASKGWKRNWLMGWRDITNATNERTVIVAPFPRSAVGNKFPLIFPDQPVATVAGLIANMSAFAFDFAARQKIGGTTLNFFLLYQLPILPPNFYTDPRLAFITPKVLELTYTSHSLAPFARDLGHDGPPFAWDEDRRALLRADLDAFYARAYGLTRDELRYILDPADVKGPDYPSETFRVLKEKEIRHHGEYRTRRLVLAAWDRMEANGEFAAMGM